MTTITTRNNYNNYRNDDFTKNNARVYNAKNTHKTFGQKLRELWDEDVEFYGKLYEMNGYRPMNIFGI